jgi:hypothetical protein
MTDYRSWAKVRPVRCEGGEVDGGPMTKVRPTGEVVYHRSTTEGEKASEVRQSLSTRKVYNK